MASSDPYPNDGYVWTTTRDGQQVREVDRLCLCVSVSVFPIFFLNGLIHFIGRTAGPIFWSKLTLYIISLT